MLAFWSNVLLLEASKYVEWEVLFFIYLMTCKSPLLQSPWKVRPYQIKATT
jgi:hypothetical protein